MTLKEFARQFLDLPHRSTNPMYKIVIGLQALNEQSYRLDDRQYLLCKAFFDADFDYNILDESIIGEPLP